MKAGSKGSGGTMVFFTICAKNFLAQAMTLHESLRQAHGPIGFYVVLCDEVDGLDLASLPFSVVTIDELGIPEWEWMRRNYNITELNTALKPFAFQLLFDLHPGGSVVYLDPDIIVTSPLGEVQAALERGASCVLTPHIAEPAEHADFGDQNFLKYGVYNLGFCAMRDTPQTRRVVAWWGRRLERYCVIDLPAGLFVDQKWADLLPAFLDDVHVLRHCGYNVAYWNLSQRRVWRDGERWMSNDQPLRFAHFSGCVIGSKTVFSRHARGFTRQNIGALGRLLEHYEDRLRANGHRWYSKLPYGFQWDGAGGTNAHTPAGSGTVRSAADEEAGNRPWLPVVRLSGEDEDGRAREAQAALFAARRADEAALLEAKEPRIEGHCALCGPDTTFELDPRSASDEVRRLDSLVCERCGLPSRVRAALHVFLQELDPTADSRVWLADADGGAGRWLSERFANLVVRDPLGNERGPAAAALPAATAASGGGFEYVLRIDAPPAGAAPGDVVAELERGLAPGGVLLVAVPGPGEPRAGGDGASRAALSCWQWLRELERAGFESPAVLGYWSRQLGYLGESQVLVMARKRRAQASALEAAVADAADAAAPRAAS